MKALLVRGSATLATCALVLAALGSVSARAATRSVSNRNDSGTGSLRQAIVSAAAGDTITFGITGTITLTSGALTIDKDLSIQGPGPHHLKISGNHASRVFVIQGGTVTVAGMTISDGRADANSPILASTGGGVLNYASLTLSNDVVSDNAALGDASAGPFGLTGWGIAGGIASFGTLSVTASQFTGNLARGGDGSVGAVGSGVGGAIGNWGPATITVSQFAGNLARGGDGYGTGAGLGGAIGNAGTLTITGSTFTFNQAISGNNTDSPVLGIAEGGAIGSGGAGQPGVMLVISGSRLDHNKAIGGIGANAYGGGITVWHAQATIDGCTLEHNEAVGGKGGSGANGGLGAGGGISATNSGEGSSITVSNSTVEHNLASGGEGGPGGNGGNGWGGGLHNDLGTTLTLSGATVSYNFALGGVGAGGSAGQGIGGGVYHLGAFSFDSTTEIEKNHASTSNDNVGP